MPAPSLRPLFTSCLLLATGLVASGCASSQLSSSYALNTPYPETARMGAVRGMEFYSICHAERNMRISEIAVRLHLQHGDTFGSCAEAAEAGDPRAAEQASARRGSAERGSTTSAGAPE